MNGASEPVGSVPKDSGGRDERTDTGSGNETGRVHEMEKQILDLKITNRAKDHVIQILREERKEIIDELSNASRRVGELETRLLQLSPRLDATAPRDENGDARDAVAPAVDGQFSDPIR